MNCSFIYITSHVNTVNIPHIKYPVVPSVYLYSVVVTRIRLNSALEPVNILTDFGFSYSIKQIVNECHKQLA